MRGRVRLIDLSVPLEDNAPHEPVPARIAYLTPDGEGLRQMRELLGVRPEDLSYSGGLGWAVEEVRAITHTGTHVDAPYHYGPASEGRPAGLAYRSGARATKASLPPRLKAHGLHNL